MMATLGQNLGYWAGFRLRWSGPEVVNMPEMENRADSEPDPRTVRHKVVESTVRRVLTANGRPPVDGNHRRGSTWAQF
jgi:hypothetical protein